MLAISLRSGITWNPEHLLPKTSLGFDYMKQEKYISGDERGGLKVAKVNLPLPDARLRLFIEGKEDWLEEGLLVPTKKNKRGRIIEEGSSATQEGSAQQNYVPPFGGILAPPSYYGGVCKTPEFHRKPESLYHRDSPWISGYRVQNVSQNNTQSHTSHHIKLIVH
jgi:hypothetical protein